MVPANFDRHNDQVSQTQQSANQIPVESVSQGLRARDSGPRSDRGNAQLPRAKRLTIIMWVSFVTKDSLLLPLSALAHFTFPSMS